MANKKGYDFKKTLISASGLVVLLIILVLVNIIFSFANIRWDTTEGKIYSLSDGTKNILSNLTQPVTIKFFCNQSDKNFPVELKLYAKRVREFLSEYEHASKGMLKVENYDPKVDSDEEEWAQKYGIQSMPLNTGDRIYCGMVFLALDHEETMGWLDPSKEALLEYDITVIIHRFQTAKKEVVGIISSLPVFGSPSMPAMPGQPQGSEPWVFITELKKTYDVLEIDSTTEKIDPSMDLLVILYPKGMTLETQYAIDQYVLSGGNALVFVDPFCVSDNTQGRQQFMRPQGVSLPTLFKSWGITVDPEKAVADMDQATRLRAGNNAIENNPLWISAGDNAFNTSDIVTSQLESMLFPVAGSLKKSENSDYDFKPLIRSGKNAALVDAFKVNFGAAAIRRDFVPADEHFNIAVQVRGKFESAFPSGPPEGDNSDNKEAKEAKKGRLKAGQKMSTIIVVADSDMLADQFYVRKTNLMGFVLTNMFNDNLNFLSNSCEILTGTDDLIGLRSRGKATRPFTVVQELQSRAQARWLSTEQELIKKMEATSRRLRELEQGKDASQGLVLSPEQEAEVKKFKEEKLRTNRELKQVRKNLRADIDKMGTTLAGINTFLMAFCVAIAGICFAIYRRRRIKIK